jgi:hypothetical protein
VERWSVVVVVRGSYGSYYTALRGDERLRNDRVVSLGGPNHHLLKTYLACAV